MKDDRKPTAPKRAKATPARARAKARNETRGEVARDAKAAVQGPLESLGKAVSAPLTGADAEHTPEEP